LKIDYLEWDSTFFGIRTGIVRNPDAIGFDHLASKDYDVIYFFIDPADKKQNDILQKEGAFLADEKTTFVKRIRTTVEQVPLNPYYRTNTVQDEQVVITGIQSGIYSRFQTDKNFPPQSFEKLYREWMEKSIDRKIAEEVFVNEKENMIKGVITIGKKGRVAEIGIVAVDQLYRGQGIGQNLLHQCETWCVHNQMKEIRVVTQAANLGACNFYTSNGFKKETVINIYHFWPHKNK
jgi:dTDP-4-amino-4,6-dideoxy-D-galactose acyltransferase